MRNSTRLAALWLAAILLFSNFPQLNAQNVAKYEVLGNGDTVPFLEYVPVGHATAPSTKKYPLIVFLHGGGQRSDDISDVWNIESYGPSGLVKRGHKMNFTWNGQTDTFIVLSPMSRATVRTGQNAGMPVGDWATSYINLILNYAVSDLKVDTNRIYLTGMSFGGGGTFRYISTAARHPQRLAAAAPVCAAHPNFQYTNGPQYVGDANLPVWGFHARNDNVTDDTLGTINPINAINNRVPAPQAKALKTIWPDGGHGIWTRVYNIDDSRYTYGYEGIINIYEWFLGQNKSLAVNTLPTANAGNDITVAKNPGTTTLNGSASTDAGGIVRYVWKKISAPAGVNLSSITITNPRSGNSSTAVSGLTTVGDYKFRLYAVDTRAAIDSDDVVIHVNDSVANRPPVANAGADQTITLPVDSIRIYGAVSDPDAGNTVSILWTFLDGPASPTIYPNALALHPIMKNLQSGVYRFVLRATDNHGLIDYDTVQVSVLQPNNTSPVANAGTDKTITLPVDSIRIYGSATDADGTIASIKWEFVDGPPSYEIYPNIYAYHPIMKHLEQGVYRFRLKAVDDDGAVDYDTVSITVVDPGNTLPVANAGPDKTITLPVDSIRIYGSATDADGTIAEIKWEFVSGPSTPTIYPNVYAYHPIMKNLEAGVYTFRFTAVDDQGGEDDDVMTITVGSNAIVEGFEEASLSTPGLAINPNPVRGILNLTISNHETGRTAIGIYDATGSLRKVEHTQKTTTVMRRSINVGEFSKGMYYVQVVVNGKPQMAKFMKQ